MLDRIDIVNLALIEDIHIDFHEGFNVLSGETGAGKSIILGAMSLLMGEKADGSLVRTGASEASVAAMVSIAQNHSILSTLVDKGIAPEDGSLLIRRVVKKSGRGSIYIQSIPVTRSDLSEISDVLFDMHGQHEHQSLLSSDRQRRVLDSYGNLGEDLQAYASEYRILEELHQEYLRVQQELAQASKEEDYLSFVVEELEKAQLKSNEDEELEAEIGVLSQYETIHESLELVHDNLKNSTGEGAVNTLALAVQAAKKAARSDISLEELSSRLEISLLEVQDIAESIRDRLSTMSFSQARLDELQSRLAQLQRLKKKYGPSLEAVISFRDASKAKLQQSSVADDYMHDLSKKIEVQETLVSQLGLRLRDKRIAAANRLQEQIATRLSHLGMPHVVFSIDITERQRTVHGSDQVDFLFSANLGEPKRSLKEIASGGELSRVMLAVKTVLAQDDDVETLVFDEVDAGIGGAVAIAVGEQMAELATTRQVIAITHLASIAAKADKHFVVHKETDAGRTFTKIRPVENDERVQEIARMLSGHGNDEKAIAHARSLLS
jgi:DNA repair protein RecN (Recombination protein N)